MKHKRGRCDLRRNKCTAESFVDSLYDVRGSGHVSACFDHRRGWGRAARPRSTDDPTRAQRSCPEIWRKTKGGGDTSTRPSFYKQTKKKKTGLATRAWLILLVKEVQIIGTHSESGPYSSSQV